MLIAGMLRRLVNYGHLVVIDASGTVHEFKGEGGPRAVIRLTDRRIEAALLWHPELALGEGYMDGRIVVEEGSIYDVIEIGSVNQARLGTGMVGRVATSIGYALRRFHQYNPAPRSRRNVAHHYDLSSTLYRMFLDADRQYSCAYFPKPGASLEEAQLAKKRHLAAKLLLEPGQKVLDIGSGWGGLGIYLAQVDEVDVTGLTLSVEQHEYAMRRVQEGGLDDRVRFLLQDYRATEGRFDRIVSVGMFEHVGINHYRQYFEMIRDRLADDGVAVIHSIGRASGPWATADFIRKYIFPGGYIPALSEVLPVIEKTGLWVTDVEILRLHYADTLKAWRERFRARWDEAADLYDERFCRMWEFYLAGSEAFFRCMDGMVFQIQLARQRDAVPLTRDYIAAEEARLAKAEPARYRLVA
ncbi:MAG TPA: cyclopropane-fatty-acyl-phospholipid synthase family protein [Geminicoccaceae bacterium]|jgi:cyclopropane-fatty-acyl-phospholipid synthase|nr:cyclopropane-fatty-acyl-phospholipid synthase family protein [Geminicoccaceae bacterium]